MVFLGETTHVLNIQFADSDIAVKFDSDPREAVAQRKKIKKPAGPATLFSLFPFLFFPLVVLPARSDPPPPLPSPSPLPPPPPKKKPKKTADPTNPPPLESPSVSPKMVV